MQCLSNSEGCQEILFAGFLSRIHWEAHILHHWACGWERLMNPTLTQFPEFSSEQSFTLGWLSVSLITHHWHLRKVSPAKWIHSLLAGLHYGYSPSPHRNIYLEENHNFDSFFWLLEIVFLQHKVLLRDFS